jgi:hypothetical protein
MVLHASTHLFVSGEFENPLRELVDIADLLAFFGSVEPGFWDALSVRASELNLGRPMFYALRYATRWLGTEVPPHVVESFDQVAPSTPVLAAMDWAVDRALFPSHPDEDGRIAAVARLQMVVRSHFLRMPPSMLARHLLYKSYIRTRARLVESGIGTESP